MTPLTAPRRAPQLSLIVLLSALALFDLLIGRILWPLLGDELQWNRFGLWRALDATARFASALVSVLALLILCAALGSIAVVGRQFRSGARISLPLVGGVTIALAAVGLTVGVTPGLEFHAQLSLVFFTLLLLVSALAAPTERRLKLGMLSLAAPLVLHFWASFGARLGAGTTLSSFWLEAASQVGWLLAAVCSPLFFAFTPRVRTRSAWLAATIAIAFGAALVYFGRGAAEPPALTGGVDLPIAFWPRAAFELLGLGGLVFTLTALAKGRETERLRGCGLLLVALAGRTLELPEQVVLEALGLLCIAESAVRPVGPLLSRPDFEELLRQGAAALDVHQITLLGPVADEVARIEASPPQGGKVTLQVTRQVGRVRAVEIAVGEPGQREPPFTLERRGQRRLGPRANGPHIETGDRAFDPLFVVRDRRGLHAPLLDDENRAELVALVQGWLAIWPGHGLVYRADELPSSPDALARLVTLMRRLAAQAS